MIVVNVLNRTVLQIGGARANGDGQTSRKFHLNKSIIVVSFVY